jgi:hypothetical protein
MKIHYMISKYLVYLIISKLDFHWLMRSQPTQHILTKGLLLVAAAAFSIAATGVFVSSAIPGQQYPFLAFAQQELGIPDTTDTDTTPTTTATDNATEATTTATDTTTTTGGNKVAGIIASLQLADRLAPEWVTAGYWELESDMPLFGAGTTGTQQPTVTNFDAIVEMVHLADGSALHSHTFSDFTQQDIVSAAENTTTISGTMTVTLQEGPVENVPVFITLQNNLLSIAMDPAATENHFGPTPISGMILAPEHLQEISNRLAPTAAEAGGGGAGGADTAAGQQEEDSASVVTVPPGSLTGQ